MNSKAQDQKKMEILPDTSVPVKGFFRLKPMPDPDSVDLFDIASLELNEYLENIERGVKATSEITKAIQEEFIDQLNQIAIEICERTSSGEELLIRIGKARGNYIARRDEYRKSRELGAEILPEKSPRELRLTKLDDGASEGERKLFLEIQRTYSVVDIVLSRREEKNERTFTTNKTDKIKRAEILRLEYLRRLKDIADEVKQYPQTSSYAMQKLTLFKEAFVSREADSVKNEHIRILGLRAILVTIPLLVIYTLSVVDVVPYFSKLMVAAERASEAGKEVEVASVRDLFNGFLMLCVGACAGTWLSFSLRRTIIGFDDLILLEPDRVHPTSRILFVILLTVIIGLLLELKWIGIWISGSEVLPSSGVMQALLIGALCGVAERSLAGVVSGKASEFMGVVENKGVEGEDRS